MKKTTTWNTELIEMWSDTSDGNKLYAYWANKRVHKLNKYSTNQGRLTMETWEKMQLASGNCLHYSKIGKK